MTEPVFFDATSGLTAQEIAALTGATLPAGASAARRVSGIAPLDRAGPSDLSFLQSPKHEAQFAATDAGICLVTRRFADLAPSHTVALVTAAPYRAFVTVAQKLFPQALRPSSLFEASGIAAGALVHPTARLENGVIVDPGAVIGPRAEIGAGTVIGATAVIGPDVRIGRDCAIGAGVTITHALIGDRVIVYPGARIGQDGFGHLPGPKGHDKVPQVGRVIIQDRVEIGANATVDRGAIRDTVIGEGSKIDNLVQIAHNVEIGRHCLLAGQTGISGSSSVGDFVMMGGQVGIADNLRIGDGAMVGASSGVGRDIPPGERYIGTPAEPVRDFMRGLKAMRRLTRQGAKDAAADGGADE
ncbi:MAG: UDP-3-O-(3-hydroxymyristoyl)glucosamine N-acyltransferase [Alphaproteobacteria bacterium]|nr:UDP-3-O-(3-hydroxymyristoyl)glucosamine N-acyltransferase [Alphaproteobacteria bacterium]